MLDAPCHESRRFDLLNPLVEPLRDLIGLNLHRASRNDVTTIENWVDNTLNPGPSAAMFSKALQTLLLGGVQEDDAYAGIVGHLAAILRALQTHKNSKRLILVVEDLGAADLLTSQVIQELLTDDRNSENIVVLATCRNSDASVPVVSEPPCSGLWTTVAATELCRFDKEKSSEDAKALTNDLSCKEREILKMMAVLGWDSLRAWLRQMRLKRIKGRPRESYYKAFSKACGQLMRRGIIRTSGLVVDSPLGGKAYREFKFVSSWHLDTIRKGLSADDERAEILKTFAGVLDDTRRSKSVRADLADVRRKVVVCELLKEVSPSDVSLELALALAQMWALLARRVRTASHHCAVYRIGRALELLKRCEGVPIAVDAEALARVAALCYALALRIYRDDPSSVELDERKQIYARAQACQSSIADIWPRDDAAGKLAYDYFHALWYQHQVQGRCLAEAETVADKWKRLFDTNKVQPTHSHAIEIWHSLAVTRFQRGKFATALTAGDEGRALCATISTSSGTAATVTKPTEPGGHSGAGCCKGFAWASRVILGDESGDEAEKRLAELEGYVKEIEGTDRNSASIIYTLIALGMICCHDFEAAEKACAQACQYQSAERDVRIRQRARMFWLCAIIGRAFDSVDTSGTVKPLESVDYELLGMDREPSRAFSMSKLVAALESCLAERINRTLEYLPLGQMFVCLGKCLCSEDDVIENSDIPLRLANQRQERFCLAELHYWKAKILEKSWKTKDAKEELNQGLEVANEQKANLFSEHCQQMPKQLNSAPGATSGGVRGAVTGPKSTSRTSKTATSKESKPRR